MSQLSLLQLASKPTCRSSRRQTLLLSAEGGGAPGSNLNFFPHHQLASHPNFLHLLELLLFWGSTILFDSYSGLMARQTFCARQCSHLPHLPQGFTSQCNRKIWSGVVSQLPLICCTKTDFSKSLSQYFHFHHVVLSSNFILKHCATCFATSGLLHFKRGW